MINIVYRSNYVISIRHIIKINRQNLNWNSLIIWVAWLYMTAGIDLQKKFKVEGEICGKNSLVKEEKSNYGQTGCFTKKYFIEEIFSRDLDSWMYGGRLSGKL